MRIGDPDGTGIEIVNGVERQSDYVHCCHCGRAHLVAASLKNYVLGKPSLGFCAKCNAPACPTCGECVPLELQIENMEAGRLALTPSAPFAAFPRNPLIIPHGK